MKIQKKISIGRKLHFVFDQDYDRGTSNSSEDKLPQDLLLELLPKGNNKMVDILENAQP